MKRKKRIDHKRTQVGRWLFPAGFLLLLNTSVPADQAIGRPDALTEVKEKIVRLVEEKKVPSLSLAVVNKSEIIWEEAFGRANLEKRIKATPGTLYPIASASKPITATGLMVLVERGVVDLDKPANAYLGGPQLRAFEGDASAATLRRILHHTSGLPMYWRFYYADASRRRPPLETVLQRYGMLVSGPGESYNYSNLGYAVLESVIEHVSGMAYPEFLTAEIFKPLGMSRATIFPAPPERPDVAEKYTSALARIPFCDHDTRGASAIYSTAHDLALLMLLHLGHLRPDQKAILKPDSVAEMQRSRDPDVLSSSYALGWETGRRFGYPIITHGGAMDGCRAHMAMIPTEGLAVAVLINGENVRSIQVCDWIFAALLPDYARNLEAASAGGGSPSPTPTFRPTSDIVGNWQGAISTNEGEIPVRLIVESNGRVELSRLDQEGRPGEALSPLKPPTLNRGLFVVHFPQVFSLDDAPSPSHRTVLGLTVRKDRLTGEANLIASDMSYSLPSYIELKRIEQERSPRSHSPDAGRGPRGCTIVMAARNGLVLAGNNEDRNHPKTIVTFIPATKTYHGRVVFGYDDGPFQGGMNDQGLFIDGNALSPTGWQPDPRKPTFRGDVTMVVLGTCATCEDVKAFFEKSNFPALERARFPAADRTGASLVVEYGQGRVQFIRSDTWYQVATNFVMSNVKPGNYPCWRYRAADEILFAAKELSPDLIRAVLEKTHQEGQSLTVYSNIYDLRKGMIHVYSLRNFEEVVVLNLAEELRKGDRRLELPSLFKSRPEAQRSEKWIGKPQNEWPQITMVNQIEYVDQKFPIAACSFLLETEKGVFAATAKHVLTYFKSASMTSVSFGASLKSWTMFPKNSPADSVAIDALINENPDEPINRICPSSVDWLLFSIKSRSDNIQPLKFRERPLQPDEKVYIIGWRYSDKDCPQVVYEGNYVETHDGSVIISTKTLEDNRMPGLSGAPVIDSQGYLIGIMSQKYGKMEKLGSIDYPRRIIAEKYR